MKMLKNFGNGVKRMAKWYIKVSCENYLYSLPTGMIPYNYEPMIKSNSRKQ